MAVSEELKTLVDAMPDPDDRGMYNGEVDKDEIEKAVAEICRGGRDNVLGLIGMLGEPGSEDNVKPHYALHCLANHVLVTRNEEARKTVCEAMAAELAADRPTHVKAFLCQELQWAGRKEAVAALGELLLDEDLVEPASMALLAIRDGAAEPFRAAVTKAKGKCRLNVVQSLGALEDAESIPALRAALDDPDAEVRLAAGWALARLGDESSVDMLLEASECDPGWNRTQATKHCFVLAEKLAAGDKKDAARKVYKHLRDTRTDPAETYIRLAAVKAMVKV